MPSVLYLDFETRSRIDLKKVGAVRYAQDPSTEVMCLVWAIDGGDVELWVPGDPVPPPLRAALRNRDMLIVAHNAFFDRHIYVWIMEYQGWPVLALERWHDTMASAAHRALPMGLDKLAEALGVPYRKDAAGHRHMLKVCRPRKPTKNNPSEWWDSPKDLERLYVYARSDIPPMRAIYEQLGPLTPRERQIWLLDQRINDRGIHIDRPATRAAIALLDEDLGERKRRVPVLTEKMVRTVDCIEQIKWWLAEFHIYPVDLSADTVSGLLLRPDLPKPVQELLETRQVASQRSVSKLHSADAWALDDDRVRGLYQYHGAFTGRPTGRGMQPTNIPRGLKGRKWHQEFYDYLRSGVPSAVSFAAVYGDIRPAIRDRMRGFITAAPGHKLVVSDFSGIELRVLMWLAGQEDALERIRAGADLYVDLAETIFGHTVDPEVEPEKRTCGKVGILGCGYQMGDAKLYVTGLGMKADPAIWTLPLANETVFAYREKYEQVPLLWAEAQDAFWSALLNPRSIYSCAGGRIRYRFSGTVMRCWLPNGKVIRYVDPEIQKRFAAWQCGPDGKPLPGETPRPTLTYLTAKGKNWVRRDLYGGKLVEQFTQATAREIQEDAKLRVDAAQPDSIVLHTYDEIGAEVSINSGLDTAWLSGLMCNGEPWLDGCPIEAVGDEAKRYWK